MENLALPAECSVSLSEFKSSGGSEGETSRSMRSPVQVLQSSVRVGLVVGN